MSRPVSFIVLPDIVTEPGNYVTRCGEIVEVDTIHRSLMANLPIHADGSYPGGIRETWDVSGRLLQSRETRNDIVAKAL